MYAENIAKGIYWFLAITLLLVVLYQLTQSPKPSFQHHGNTASSNSTPDKYMDHPRVKKLLNSKKKKSKKKKRKEYNYQKYEVPIKIINESHVDQSLFGYKQLVEMIDDPIFLSQYRNAILDSMKHKYDIYSEKLIEVTRELIEALEKKGGGPMAAVQLDTATTRLERMKVMIEQVLREIPKRIASISSDEVKRDLHDAIYNEDSGLCSLIGREDIKDFLALQMYSFSKNPFIFLKNFQNILI